MLLADRAYLSEPLRIGFFSFIFNYDLKFGFLNIEICKGYRISRSTASSAEAI